MSVIHTVSLEKSYGQRRGVSDVNLAIGQGEIFGFLGPNGAGKSTTIRMLLGFLAPDGGSASVLGSDCWSQSHVIKKEVGYVAGDVRLYAWLTADRAFDIVSRIRGREIHTTGRNLADRFRLETDLPVRKMSRGNRQKLALVLALAHEPQLAILDEPTSGLDPLIQDVLSDCLREMAARGQTVFFSSHTLSEVENLCDRVAIIRDGRIVVDDRIQHLKQQAPRTASLTFASEQAAAEAVLPNFVHLRQRYKTECRLEIHGSAVEFTHWASQQLITDVSISQPSLDALFRRYYEETE